MPDISGVLTTLNHALPQGLDGGRLAQWRLKNGRTYDQVRADVAASFDGLNSQLAQAWGDMIYITTDDYFEYPNGGALEDFITATDLDRPTSHKGGTVGHMLPLSSKKQSIGGTVEFFRDSREQTIVATVRDRSQAGRNTLEKDVLTRFFSNAEVLLGTAGYDVGFADGSITVQYAPPSYGGQDFTTSHDHYLAYNTSASATYSTMLEGMAQTVQEHGHQAPFIAYVAEADVESYRALTRYSEPVTSSIYLVDRGGVTTGNQYFQRGTVDNTPPSGGRWIGSYSSAYGMIELRSTYRIPTGYAGLYKSYGTNDPRNAIGFRIHPDVGFGFYINEIPSYSTTWPVKVIEITIEYGVSCGNDRTMGAAARIGAGITEYTVPTIS